MGCGSLTARSAAIFCTGARKLRRVPNRVRPPVIGRPRNVWVPCSLRFPAVVAPGTNSALDQSMFTAGLPGKIWSHLIIQLALIPFEPGFVSERGCCCRKKPKIGMNVGDRSSHGRAVVQPQHRPPKSLKLTMSRSHVARRWSRLPAPSGGGRDDCAQQVPLLRST